MKFKEISNLIFHEKRTIIYVESKSLESSSFSPTYT